jgi:DNA helicase IV
MVSKDVIQREQLFVDKALEARESRRQKRDSGEYSLAGAVANSMNTMAGGPIQQLGEIADRSEEVCFANVIKEDNERFYIGKYVIHNDDRDLLVCSWKSEVGSLFYRSSIKAPLGLIGKCRLLFDKPNHVIDVEENLYKEIQTRIENLTKNYDLDVSDAVLDELDKGSSGSLKEIIKTIHASQHEIISAERGGLHVIQGAPGTGKTVVGVHRASWLLFPGNDEKLKAEKTLFVGPNMAFIRYIENVIPSLGDEKIIYKDLSKLGPNLSVTGNEDRKLAKLKGDLRMKSLLVQALRDRVRLPEVDVIFNPPGQGRSISLSAEGIRLKIKELLDESVLGDGRNSYNISRTNFKIWLLNSVNAILKENYQSESNSSRNTPFVKESDLESLVERGWPSISALSFLRDLYSNQGRLITAGKELDFQVKELVLLVREPSPQISKEPWTVADVALLDFLENQLQGTDLSDQFDYIIVDEAQDMTPMQLESIRRRSGSGDILLMGDLAQATGPWVHSSWKVIADCINKPIERMDELEFGYRVPKQVFEYASRVLSYINPELKSPRLVRDVANSPIDIVASNYAQLIDVLIDDLLERTDPSAHTGLIIGDNQVAPLVAALTNANVEFSLLENNSPIKGLNIVPASRQKGLEFDDVILFEPKEIIYIPEIGLRQLYVAITRSLRGLRMYATQELPIQLLEESKLSNKSGLDSIVAEYASSAEPEKSSGSFAEIKRDIEGYLRVKGLTLKEFINKVSNSEGGE